MVILPRPNALKAVLTRRQNSAEPSKMVHYLCKELRKYASPLRAALSFLQITNHLAEGESGWLNASLACRRCWFQMSTNNQEQVSEHRAATLLGLSMAEIRRFARLCGLGRLEKDDRGEQVVFTYEELRRLCLLAAQSSK